MNATAIGYWATANAVDASSLGSNANANARNSVALGANSVADVADTVSVGSSSAQRRIVNVATGTIGSGSTDAVTGGQLFTANQRVADAFGTTLDGTGQLNAPNYTIQAVSYSNVGNAFTAVDNALTANATGISNLQSQLNAGSIGLVQQAGSGQPVTVGAATNGAVVDFTGTAGTRTLTGLSAAALTSASTDAVTGGQLYGSNQRIAAALGTTLDGSGQFNAPTYTILAASYSHVGNAFTAVDNALTANATGIGNLQSQLNAGSIGLVQQAGSGQPITVGAATNGAVVDFTGTAGTRTLTGLSAAALTSASTDAVTGGQLYGSNQRIATALGTTLDGSGQFNAPTYTIQGVTFSNAASAFTAVDNAFSGLQTQISTGSIGLVQQNPATRVISVGAATDGSVIDVAGTSGTRTLTGVAAGALSANSTDAVNGGQLFATNQQVAANTGAISALTGQVAINTSDIATLSSTVAGISQSNSYVRVNSSGAAANASGVNAIAVGTNAQATQAGAIAVGLNASSTGVNAIAIGTGASATGSVAVGTAASAANGGAAFGDGAVATGSHATALGPNSSATAANSVAIGSGSTNTVANTVSFGSAGNERRLTNVAAGTSTTDAVNVGQLQSTVLGIQSQLNGLKSDITANRVEARRGIVAAVAVAPVLMPSAVGKTTVAVNTGYYRGEFGVGIGLSHRLNLALPTVIYGSYSNGGGAEHVGRAGIAMEF